MSEVDARDNYDYTPLFLAFHYGKLKNAVLLLEAGADLSIREEEGDISFIRARANGDLDMLKLLLENGATVNEFSSNGNAALMTAVNHEKTEVARFLLENGADVNHKGEADFTALMDAVVVGNLDLMHLLIDHGVELDVQTHDGRTLRFFIDQSDRDEIKQLLLPKLASR